MTIKAYFDGSCEPINPGGTCAYGAIIYVDDTATWQISEVYKPEIPGQTSNNIAEYLGFISVIDCLRDKDLVNIPKIIIHGDSKLVIEQMSGNWRIKSGLYAPFAHRAKELLSIMPVRPTLKWIPREMNSVADGLSRGIKLPEIGNIL